MQKKFKKTKFQALFEEYDKQFSSELASSIDTDIAPDETSTVTEPGADQNPEELKSLGIKPKDEDTGDEKEYLELSKEHKIKLLAILKKVAGPEDAAPVATSTSTKETDSFDPASVGMGVKPVEEEDDVINEDEEVFFDDDEVEFAKEIIPLLEAQDDESDVDAEVKDEVLADDITKDETKSEDEGDTEEDEEETGLGSMVPAYNAKD